ncbi:MAG: hypothetical protein V1842_00040 [Candidatus Omnitrophota bacterium]
MLKWARIGLAAIFWLGVGRFSYLLAQERDPFVSIVDLQEERLKTTKSKVDLSRVVLKGILWNQSRAVAIIDDNLVMTGDEWGGFKVARIDKDRVILSDGEKSYPLFIKEEVPAFNASLTNVNNHEQPADINPVFDDIHRDNY